MTTALLEPNFGIRISNDEYAARALALHKQLFASTEFGFDEVTRHVYAPPPGMFQVDHSIIHDGDQWHLYYQTGDIKRMDEYVQRLNAGDYARAAEVTICGGHGHAAGPTLLDLKFIGNERFPSQGAFDTLQRSVCSLFRYGDRYGMLYDVRGASFHGMSLAWSDDLNTWQLDPDNPFLHTPTWAATDKACKDPHVMCVDGVYLIYYITRGTDGYPCVALASTRDWKSSVDEGPVFSAVPNLRGTMGLESPCVVERNGLWHLFITYGPGLWHAISNSPRSFGLPAEGLPVGDIGMYFMGHFHATEIVEHDGRWWMTTDRKEETRRLNRQAGRLCYRGTYADDRTLEEGLYLSQLHWQGDQPILEQPDS